MKLGMQIGLGLGHTVLDRDPAPPGRGDGELVPQFLTHICCGQMAGWIKMPLGMEVGLGPVRIVLDGDPARPAPEMDKDETRHASRPRPWPHCVR